MPFETPQQRSAFMDRIVGTIAERLSYLWGRWQDEHKYEDWADYQRAIETEVREKLAADKVTAVRTTKRPFGVVIRAEGLPYDAHITINANSIGWKQVQ